MRFFASWWERIPVRVAAPVTIAVLVGLTALPWLADWIDDFSRAAGSIWD